VGAPAARRAEPAPLAVVIGCKGINVVLAHLRRGSIAVRLSESVTAGQGLAEAGNSGNTSEPHLHRHAVRPESGKVRNTTFFWTTTQQ
jgi:murein DD-endopeptidase MepM/ murein hydrolase activator NlpD